MEYIEAVFTLIPADSWRDIFTAELAESGFESFEHTPDGLKAWCPLELFDEIAVSEIISRYSGECSITWKHGEIEPVNWNEEWEKNYAPVLIDGRCLIRAPFHESAGSAEYEIVIEPKMSFGTAHHETTRLMIGWLLRMELKGRAVLDMGCGTGVLAILAAKRGATSIIAIDNYIWAYTNTVENAERNDIKGLNAIHGDVTALAELKDSFDLIVANINRNVLAEDIPIYAQKLKPQGELLVSGFFAVDESSLDRVAEQCCLVKTGRETLGQWRSVLYKLSS